MTERAVCREVERAKGLLDAAHRLYEEMVAYHHQLGPVLQKNVLSEGELCDVGFLHREIASLLNEARKECESRQLLVGKILALTITRRSVEDPSAILTARGELATATPDVKMRPILPKKGTDDYRLLLDFFGVPKEIAESGVLEMHYPRLSDWLTAAAESGRPAPPGLLGQTPEPQVTFRKRK